MAMCPICNGLTSVEIQCEQCHSEMSDKGRLLDYFDDYSAYLDIDGMKLFDGITDDQKNNQCPHVFYCYQCHMENTILIDEI
ncbi:hypothetical protein BKP45_01000 [Anaerobacillus alkalidiazotrophicus]|uniref:Uncharacterized protein n=1 Tax=Anaerobacillus alkalidiazotrophicus TaxID=472963 RepID=A0A1S2M9H7_9BACI|nr:hypothetical protein [Anaerobacillus alkalidiazotrophicus]OIJ21388.1 hypothetical protein BKP45_01000 [Anaerobacillus alkalidiazotrophicus]